jgi:hypothetical protein
MARSRVDRPRITIGFVLSDPFILRYKDDPRFAAFCRKVGLPVPGETSAQIHLRWFGERPLIAI